MTAFNSADPANVLPMTEPAESGEKSLSDLLDELGAGGGEALTVTVYRGVSHRNGEYLTTYDGEDFSLQRVQQDHGVGRYYAQVKQGKRLVRGGSQQFTIGPAARSARPEVAAVAAPVVAAPIPAAGPALDFGAMFLAMMKQQGDILTALASRRDAAPAPQGLTFTDALALVDKLGTRSAPRSSLTELIEAMTTLKALSGDGGGGGGSDIAEIMKAAPALLASIPKGDASSASIETHPAVVQAQRIVEAYQRSLAARTAVLPAAPSPAPAPSSKPEAPASDDPRTALIREAAPMLKVLIDFNGCTPVGVAQMVIDAVEIRGLNVDEFTGEKPGELADLVIGVVPELAARRAFLLEVEEAIRSSEDDEGDGDGE